jgi:hypothetical protein
MIRLWWMNCRAVVGARMNAPHFPMSYKIIYIRKHNTNEKISTKQETQDIFDKKINTIAVVSMIPKRINQPKQRILMSSVIGEIR